MIANGSLLVPVPLTLAAVFHAVLEMRASRKADYELLQPILRHHLEVLKDDRGAAETLLELLVKGARAGEAESSKNLRPLLHPEQLPRVASKKRTVYVAAEPAGGC